MVWSFSPGGAACRIDNEACHIQQVNGRILWAPYLESEIRVLPNTIHLHILRMDDSRHLSWYFLEALNFFPVFADRFYGPCADIFSIQTSPCVPGHGEAGHELGYF